MYTLTDRISILREEMVHRKKDFFKPIANQWGVNYIIGLAEAKSKYGDTLTSGEYQCNATVSVVENAFARIMPLELIVGYNFHYSVGDWYPPYIQDREVLEKEGFSKERLDKYFSVMSFSQEEWKKRFPTDRNQTLEYTAEEQQAMDDWAMVARCVNYNHSVIGYEKVVKLGFDGLKEEVECYEHVNGKKSIYTQMKALCEAGATLGERYAEKAKQLLEENAPEYRQEDLEKIIQTCSRVPRKPATNFMEAVQAIYFAHIINTWEDAINANSIGRLDQILYPYYKKDIEEGRLTKNEAFEIICCLWLKLYRDYDVQQSCVGGTDVNGNSQVNELSYMMLEATEQLNFIRCLSVRFSKNTEKDFLQKALEVVGHVQKGVPFFFNDDVMIPALESRGISHEDACDYTQLGCVETVIPGKSNPHAVTGQISCIKALEYVFNNGKSMVNSAYAPGIKTGELSQFKTYEQLYNAVLKQIERILDLTCSAVVKTTNYCVTIDPRPYKALLTEGCMEKGLDYSNGGAKYDYYQMMFCGIPNLADSLAVIKKYVYTDKKYTLLEMKEILEKDFPDEAIRKEFINKVPKYGNDMDEVDDIVVDISNQACDMLERMTEKYHLDFHAQLFTFLWMEHHGAAAAASPDGRKRGDFIAYSMSPMQGRDFNGLTAVLNSISKLPTKRTPGTASAIVEVDPKLFTDENLGILTDILITAGKNGLSNIQFNTIDVNTLLEAQKNPEKYNNLAVRVSGFSQKFNLLSPSIQNHIIGRTKHSCL